MTQRAVFTRLLCTCAVGLFGLTAFAEDGKTPAPKTPPSPSNAAPRSAGTSLTKSGKVDPAALSTATFAGQGPSVTKADYRPAGDNGADTRGCVNCTDGTIQENEPECGLVDHNGDGIPDDLINGGCNSTPPVSIQVECGDIICGTGAFDSSIGYRDTDWYDITLAGPGQTDVTITCTAEFNSLIGFVGFPCPQFNFLAYTFGAPCQTVSVTRCLPAGTYYLFVAPDFVVDVPCSGPGNAYRFAVSCAPSNCPPPANDNCANAQLISCGQTVNGSNVNSTTDGFAPCGASGNDVWYKFVATQTQAVISTCGLTVLDTVLAAYDGCGGNLLVCLDDFCGLQTQITLNGLSIGTTYWFSVSGFASSTGDFAVSVTCQQPPPPPGNDSCATPTPITCGASISGTNAGATNDGLQPSCSFAGLPTNSDVWYSFVATDTTAVADTCGGGSMSDTVVTIYGSCGGAELACNDDFCGLLSSATANGLTPGNTYYVRVAGWNQEPQGTFTLTVTCRGPCATAQPGDIEENEPFGGCADEYVDAFNGGCNSVPPAFSEIDLGDSVHGESGTFLFAGGQYRDTDWWLVSIPERTILTWTVTADFPVLIGFVAQPCPQFSFLSFAFGDACSEVSLTSTCLAAGEYVAFVAPQGFSGVSCGSQYRGTLNGVSCETGACCVNGTCSVMLPGDCAAAGGSYLGNGTDCGGQNYVVTRHNVAMEDISGSGAPGCVGDDCSSLVALGFTFTFYGNAFTDINVGSNGHMRFGGGAFTFGNPPSLPNPGDLYDNIVAPYWDDWRTDGVCPGATLHTQTLGSAPNRRFIAQWTNVCHFSNNAQRATFQGILYEASGNIEYRYGTPLDLNSPVVGIENSDGSAGENVTPIPVSGESVMIAAEATGDPCGCECAGDVDGNGVVNLADLAFLLSAFGSSAPFSNPCVDIDGNGVVNLADLAFLLSAFGSTCP